MTPLDETRLSEFIAGVARLADAMRRAAALDAEWRHVLAGLRAEAAALRAAQADTPDADAIPGGDPCCSS